MGRTNERIGRIQETYVTDATTSWLESLERSLAQMKDYQVSLQNTHKTMSDHYSRHERSWKAVDWPMIHLWLRCRKRRKRITKLKKNCGHRKPSTKKPARTFTAGCRTWVLHKLFPTVAKLTIAKIKEVEADSVADLGAFVDAELKYYDRCRDVLMQLKQSWPAA